MSFELIVDLPEWVTIPTSEMASEYVIARVVSTWRNNVKVVWMGRDGPHEAIYTSALHVFREPTDAEWHEYHDRTC
jgi:hypothetical protein